MWSTKSRSATKVTKREAREGSPPTRPPTGHDHPCRGARAPDTEIDAGCDRFVLCSYLPKTRHIGGLTFHRVTAQPACPRPSAPIQNSGAHPIWKSRLTRDAANGRIVPQGNWIALAIERIIELLSMSLGSGGATGESRLGQLAALHSC